MSFLMFFYFLLIVISFFFDKLNLAHVWLALCAKESSNIKIKEKHYLAKFNKVSAKRIRHRFWVFSQTQTIISYKFPYMYVHMYVSVHFLLLICIYKSLCLYSSISRYIIYLYKTFIPTFVLHILFCLSVLLVCFNCL